MWLGARAHFDQLRDALLCKSNCFSELVKVAVLFALLLPIRAHSPRGYCSSFKFLHWPLVGYRLQGML